MSSNPDQQPVFNIQRVYLRDLSLEIPNAPQIFLEQTPPAVEVQLDVSAQQLVEGIYESIVTVTVTTKVGGDKVAFLVEAKQAGIFEIRNVPQDQMEPFLLGEAPRILFPFARQIVNHVIQDGGFPPLLLEPIDFGALFMQRMAQHLAGEGGVTAGEIGGEA